MNIIDHEGIWLNEVFDKIRKMDVTPFGRILDFLIEQGMTKQQAISWFDVKDMKTSKTVTEAYACLVCFRRYVEEHPPSWSTEEYDDYIKWIEDTYRNLNKKFNILVNI